MKRLGVMQPYWLPYLGYFQLIHAVDDYVIYDDVQFIKGGRINRNYMLVGGRKTRFTMALHDASPNRLINQIEIADDFTKFHRSIDLAYARAPFRDQVVDLLRGICSFPDRNLARFLGNSLGRIADYLGITTELMYSSALDKDSSLDAQDRLIAMCKLRGADHYLNAAGGRELYQKEAFQREGVELQFLQPGPVRYEQLGGDFEPNLSILDVMMFNSPAAIQEMLEHYELS